MAEDPKQRRGWRTRLGWLAGELMVVFAGVSAAFVVDAFDRLLRSGESLSEKWLYIEENPVRAGLAKHYLDWPYRYAFNEL